MSEEHVVLAVPSVGAGGLEAERSGHFGRCDCFTVIELCEGAITSVRTVDNPAHVEGGCLRPVEILSSEGVNALIVAGIGGRPLAGFNDAGITVHFDNRTPSVRDVVELFLAGEVGTVGTGCVCGEH